MATGTGRNKPTDLHQKVSRPNSFLLAIGSFARGNMTERSDIDLVAIGRPKSKDVIKQLPQGRQVNIVHFSPTRFRSLHQAGDLFLYHIFTEGKLLHGAKEEFAKLKDSFTVQTNFDLEIRRNVKLLDFLLSDPENTKGTLSFLTNLFRALKQIAIFRLASKRIYIFEKHIAIATAFPWINQNLIESMLDAEKVLLRDTGAETKADLKKLERAANELYRITKRNRSTIC